MWHDFTVSANDSHLSFSPTATISNAAMARKTSTAVKQERPERVLVKTEAEDDAWGVVFVAEGVKEEVKEEEEKEEVKEEEVKEEVKEEEPVKEEPVKEEAVAGVQPRQVRLLKLRETL